MFTGSLLPSIVYLTKCMGKKKEKLKESEKLSFIPLIDAITATYTRGLAILWLRRK